MSNLHGEQTTNDGIHIAYTYHYADATERESDTERTAADVGKFFRQLDNNTIWMLTATTPTWVAIGGGITSGAFSLTGTISPTAITADQNDYNPTGLSSASVLRLSASGNYKITSVTGGSDGRILIIHNTGSSNDLQLTTDDGASGTAANRLYLQANLRLFPKCSAILQYDGTTSRWRCIGHSGAFAGEVVQRPTPTLKTDVFTSTSSSYTPITGMSATITPRSSTSVIRVTVAVALGGDGGGKYYAAARVMRGATPIFVGDAAGSRTQGTFWTAGDVGAPTRTIVANDTPATTSSTTYSVEGRTLNAGVGFAINKSYSNDGDFSEIVRVVSSMVLEEICQ